MLSINTNLSSLIAQSSMKESTKLLNQAVERMTTGFKINHAKDNAANYSISTNMSTKISAYNVAEENTAMGLDMLTTASESLSLIEDKLMRLRALATQASNGTYGKQSLKAINTEVNAIIDEIERDYSNASYNGIDLLNKTTASAEMPVETFDGFIKEVIKRDTSTMTTFASVDPNTALADGTYSISTPEEMKKLADMTNVGLVSAGDEFVLANNIDLSQYENWTPIGQTYSTNPFKGKFDGNGYSIKNLRINTDEGEQKAYPGTGLFGTTRSAIIKNLKLENAKIETRNKKYVGGIGGLCYNSTISNCTVENLEIIAITAGGVVGESQRSSIQDCYVNKSKLYGKEAGGIASYINSHKEVDNCYVNSYINATKISGGIVATVSAVNTTKIYNCFVLNDTNNLNGIFVGSYMNTGTSNVELKNCCYNTYIKDISLIGERYIGHLTTTNIDTISPLSLPNNNINLQVGINSDENSKIGLNIGLDLTFLQNLRGIGLYEFDINMLDLCLNEVSKKQNELGAVSNRLESVLEEISIQYDNLVSSRSTIRDADIANVSSQYIQQQILQEAAATLLSTANQTPSIALGLI